jgi:hypothetical protein
MYKGVPIMPDVSTSETSSPKIRPVSAALEIPKSKTLISSRSPRRVKNKLPGLMSRWVMPKAWAKASASQACITYSVARRTEREPF